MALDKDLVSILRCPKCHGEIELDAQESSFICQQCQLRYSIVREIPNFLIEEAMPLNEQSKAQ